MFIAALLLAASPMIFKVNVADEKAIARPMQKSLVGLSLKQINDFRRAQNVALYTGDYCYIEAMRKDGIALTSRREQQFLDEALAKNPVSFDTVTKGGVRLTVGIYEKCQKDSDEDYLNGSLLVATRDGTLLWASEYPATLPLYIYPSDGSPIAKLSSCMECGDVTELFYDSANRKFYTQYVGD